MLSCVALLGPMLMVSVVDVSFFSFFYVLYHNLYVFVQFLNFSPPLCFPLPFLHILLFHHCIFFVAFAYDAARASQACSLLVPLPSSLSYSERPFFVCIYPSFSIKLL